MEKRSKKEPTLSFSPRAPQNERALPPTKPKRWLLKSTTATYRALQTKYRSAPAIGVTTQAHAREFWSIHE
jgi:hypothetical protein